MALGQSAAFADTALDAALAVYKYVKLHTGDPGAAGTANAATETTRELAAFNSAASASADTSADLVWSAVAGSETYSHFSLWSASTAGTFGGSGTVTADPVTAGNDFKIVAGDLTVTYTVAS